MKTVCVDYNGVLDTYTGWRGPDYFYPPRKGAREFLQALNERGFRLVKLLVSLAAFHRAGRCLLLARFLQEKKQAHLKTVASPRGPDFIFVPLYHLQAYSWQTAWDKAEDGPIGVERYRFYDCRM